MSSQTEEKVFYGDVKITTLLKVKFTGVTKEKAEEMYMEYLENLDAEQLKLQVLGLAQAVTYEVQDAYAELEYNRIADEENPI